MDGLRVFVVTALSLLCVSQWKAAATVCPLNASVTKFVMAFPTPCPSLSASDGDLRFRLALTSSPSNDYGVKVVVGSTAAVTLSPGQTSTQDVVYNGSMALRGSRLQQGKVVNVTVCSSKGWADILVHATLETLPSAQNSYMRANAAVRVPPTTWLSTDYTVATHCQNEHCLLAIVPAYDDTVVSITLRLRNSDTNNGSSPTLLYDDVVFQDGDVITEVLNQSLAVQVLCSACDMSGTRVVSSQPVAVLSGGEVTSAGDTSTTHGITLEFIPPTSSLGTQYIIATNPTNFAYTVKIVATQPGTRISVFGECLTTGEDSDAWTLDYPADRQSTVLEASEPVLVALIIEDATSPGDVRMVVLVPTSHWSSTGYEVVKPFPTSTNSLMIVVGVADMYAVRFSLGGQWLGPWMSSPSIELVQDMPDLAVIFVPIDQEQCHLSLTCNAFSSSACQPFWGYVGGAMVGNGGWALPLAYFGPPSEFSSSSSGSSGTTSGNILASVCVDTSPSTTATEYTLSDTAFDTSLISASSTAGYFTSDANQMMSDQLTSSPFQSVSDHNQLEASVSDVNSVSEITAFETPTTRMHSETVQFETRSTRSEYVLYETPAAMSTPSGNIPFETSTAVQSTTSENVRFGTPTAVSTPSVNVPFETPTAVSTPSEYVPYQTLTAVSTLSEDVLFATATEVSAPRPSENVQFQTSSTVSTLSETLQVETSSATDKSSGDFMLEASSGLQTSSDYAFLQISATVPMAPESVSSPAPSVTTAHGDTHSASAVSKTTYSSVITMSEVPTSAAITTAVVTEGATTATEGITALISGTPTATEGTTAVTEGTTNVPFETPTAVPTPSEYVPYQTLTAVSTLSEDVLFETATEVSAPRLSENVQFQTSSTVSTLSETLQVETSSATDKSSGDFMLEASSGLQTSSDYAFLQISATVPMAPESVSSPAPSVITAHGDTHSASAVSKTTYSSVITMSEVPTSAAITTAVVTEGATTATEGITALISGTPTATEGTTAVTEGTTITEGTMTMEGTTEGTTTATEGKTATTGTTEGIVAKEGSTTASEGTTMEREGTTTPTKRKTATEGTMATEATTPAAEGITTATEETSPATESIITTAEGITVTTKGTTTEGPRAKKMCSCRCKPAASLNRSKEVQPPENLSPARRKSKQGLTRSTDTRTSAAVLGCLGATVLVGVALIIACFDLVNALGLAKAHTRQRSSRSQRSHE